MFRVVNWENGSGDEDSAAMTLKDAALRRLEISGYRHEFRRIRGAMTLFLSGPEGGPLIAVAKSDYADDVTATDALYQWIADAPLTGPYIVVTDQEYELSAEPFDADEDDDMAVPAMDEAPQKLAS